MKTVGPEKDKLLLVEQSSRTVATQDAGEEEAMSMKGAQVVLWRTEADRQDFGLDISQDVLVSEGDH